MTLDSRTPALPRRDAVRRLAGTGLALAAPAALTVGGTAARAADDWPTRTVRILVANPPGQAVDIVARLFADALGKAFGQSFIVDNKPGAGGMIATEAGARAAPDGYTLTVTSSGPLVITPAINPKVPYDPLRDFAHIANIALTPQMIFVGAGSPWRSIGDLIAAAKAKPGEINYGTSGIGSTSHLGMESFAATAGIRLNHVPFKGNQEMINQVIGGTLELGLDTVPGARTLIQSGKLRGLGVAAPERSPFLPDVPTLIEQGQQAVALGWIGLSGPAGLPRPIVDKVNKAILAAMQRPDFKERFDALAFVSLASTPDEFTRFVADERAKWQAVAKAAGIRVE